MRRVPELLGVGAAAITLAWGLADAALASGSTYTLQCGSTTYTVVKANDNAASYTNGTMIFVNAIGAIKTDGTAQPTAVACTINGFGPIPFIITPAH